MILLTDIKKKITIESYNKKISQFTTKIYKKFAFYKSQFLPIGPQNWVLFFLSINAKAITIYLSQQIPYYFYQQIPYV